MKHLSIDPKQPLELIGNETSTVIEVVSEAINFCKDHKVKDCSLSYNGFLFDIEPDSVLTTKIDEYIGHVNSADSDKIKMQIFCETLISLKAPKLHDEKAQELLDKLIIVKNEFVEYSLTEIKAL